jgi:hypothetical protein
MELHEIREKLKEMYGGENKPITDGHYDQSLAVKCINGTFVGRKTDNITVFRGIPPQDATTLNRCGTHPLWPSRLLVPPRLQSEIVPYYCLA